MKRNFIKRNKNYRFLNWISLNTIYFWKNLKKETKLASLWRSIRILMRLSSIFARLRLIIWSSLYWILCRLKLINRMILSKRFKILSILRAFLKKILRVWRFWRIRYVKKNFLWRKRKRLLRIAKDSISGFKIFIMYTCRKDPLPLLLLLSLL